MASSKRTIEQLTGADLSDCLALSEQAQWNQVASDWQIFLDHGIVWGVRERARVVASAALLPYPPGTAWISMVLTAESARGQGLASDLTRWSMQECARRGLTPQLDATPDGERVYEKLGFLTIARLTRWRKAAQSSEPDRSALPSLSDADADAVVSRDAEGIGFARPALLRRLQQRGPAKVTANAFALSRDGRTAHQIGPLVATTWESAEPVLATLIDALEADRPIIIDANDESWGLASFLEARGYRPERPFSRMAGGPGAPRPDLSRYLAAAGPEFG